MPMRRAVRITRHAISPRLAISIFLNISGRAQSLSGLRPHFPDHIWPRVFVDESFSLRRSLFRRHRLIRHVEQQIEVGPETFRNDRKAVEAENANSILSVFPN